MKNAHRLASMKDAAHEMLSSLFSEAKKVYEEVATFAKEPEFNLELEMAERSVKILLYVGKHSHVKIKTKKLDEWFALSGSSLTSKIHSSTVLELELIMKLISMMKASLPDRAEDELYGRWE